MRDLQSDIRQAAEAQGDDDDIITLPIPRPCIALPIDDEIAIDEPIIPAVSPAAIDIGPAAAIADAIGAVPAPALIDHTDSDDMDLDQDIAFSDIVARSDDEPEPSPAAPGVAIPHEELWPAEFESLPLIQTSGRSGGIRGKQAPRLGVRCLCCDYYKSRSIDLLVPELGRKAPLYFLGAWLQRMGQPGHNHFVPSLADCQAYAAAHP